MDTRRVTAIEEWPTPRSFHKVQQFLGFANFYRRFVRWYSKIVGPLTNLMKGSKDGRKRGPLTWVDDEEHAFRCLKDAFQKAPVLRHYDPALPMRVETDASAYALGGILTPLYEGAWHPIAYWSRKMIPAECNYETHDQELLAVVEAFKQWRPYLEGAQHAISVIVDHANLKGFMKVKQLNGRQARWATFLAPFDFTIEHRAGKKNPADAPSRRPDYARETQTVNHLLPSLQSKLRVWANPSDAVETTARRVAMTCQRLYSDQIQAAEVEFPPPENQSALPMRVATAAVSAEDPYMSPSDWLMLIVRMLQERDPDLRELRAQASVASAAHEDRGSSDASSTGHEADAGAQRGVDRQDGDADTDSHEGRGSSDASGGARENDTT